MRIVKRAPRSGNAARNAALAGVLIAVLLALFTGACFFLFFGVNPLTAYGHMLTGVFGDFWAFTEVLVKTTPLLFIGLAVTLAVRMQLWNIGCEGQLVMGGIFTAGFALYIAPGLPPWLMIPCLLLAGALGGMFWAAGPALFKAYNNTNEILTTLLLNYVAVIVMEHLYYSPWRDPMGFGFPGTAMLPDAAFLPRWTPTRIHLGLAVALVLAPALWWLLQRTKWGFSIRVLGQSPGAANYAGVNIRKQTMLVLMFSGAIAGLAGMSEVCGIQHRLQEGLSIGYGFDGIIVAFLARLNPLAMPVAAFLLGALQVGGDQLQSELQLPSSISLVIEAALLFGFLAGDFLNSHRIVFNNGGADNAVSGGKNT